MILSIATIPSSSSVVQIPTRYTVVLVRYFWFECGGGRQWWSGRQVAALQQPGSRNQSGLTCLPDPARPPDQQPASSDAQPRPASSAGTGRRGLGIVMFW